MVKGDEEEAARKLALLEGDRRAYLESSQAAAKQNAEKIAELKKENKALLARLRSLKTEPTAAGAPQGTKGVQQLDIKASEQIKKHNVLRHQTATKLKRIEELEKALRQLELEEGGKGGGDAQTLRELENRLDKAVIKAQEAEFIGKTYKQIITRLQQDRLTYDGRVTSLEQTIAARKQEIARLEAMLTDASLARDVARADLAKLEQDTQAARQAREQEKKRLQTLAEERRRQYEAMEKRLRLASVGEEKEDTGQPLPQDLALRLAAFEKAFRRLQDAAGVASPEDVLARFAAQAQTKEHLEKLAAQNSELHAKLKLDYEAALAKAEAAQFSGEHQAAASRAELAASEERLKAAEARLATVRAEAEAAQKQLVVVAAGIDSLCDKLQASTDSRPSTLSERLGLAAGLLKGLVGELGTRSEELAAMHDEDLFAIVELPAHNVRVPLPTTQKEGEGAEASDSGDEDESALRLTIKKQAANLVESKTAKPKKKKGDDDD